MLPPGRDHAWGQFRVQTGETGQIQSSHARNDRDVTYGLAQITDIRTNMVVAGAGYTLNIDEVADYANQA